MNWLQFIKLMREIFGKDLPNLDYIQSQGLLAVKIGQVFALRVDFLNQEKCRHLSKLYRSTNKIPEENSIKLIKKYSNDQFKKNISKISKNPIASASIGQVHTATNKNEKVAIKIIKSNFKESFTKDVKSLEKFFKFSIFFYPKLAKVADPLGILADIEKNTLAELDLRNEIDGHKKLQKIFYENKNKFDLSKLKFAKIYEELSGENLMVSEFVEGKTFDELLDQKKLDYNKLLDLFLIHGFYMFIVGTFHGDIHPGNIILKKDKIYFVDTGAIGHVGREIRDGLFDFFESLSNYDYKKCAYFLNQMAAKKIEGKKYDNFEKKFLELYSDFSNKTVSQVSLTKKMMDTIKLGVNSGMEFEKGIFSIIKSLMYLDGMVLRCKPDAVLLKDMRPFIKQFKEAKNFKSN